MELRSEEALSEIAEALVEILDYFYEALVDKLTEIGLVDDISEMIEDIEIAIDEIKDIMGLSEESFSELSLYVKNIMAEAIIGGFEVKDEKVKALVYSCLLGDGAKEVLKEFGIDFDKKITNEKLEGIANVAGAIIKDVTTKLVAGAVLNATGGNPLALALTRDAINAAKTIFTGK